MLPSAQAILDDVRRALAEDIGAGDLTAALISPGASARAKVISREAAVLCGAAWFEAVIHELDAAAVVTWQATDGDAVAPDQILCTVHGSARALLSGERTALNFLQTLSGTATLARRYADAVRGTGVQVLDTRKTLPGLRRAQKYAVTCGGCHNHRMGLYDGILIKENHVRAAGSLSAALRAAQASAHRERDRDVLVEVEVRNFAELSEALQAGAKRILLDNFTLPDLNIAVRKTRKRAALEVSGGVTLENIRAIAETGVDFISAGALTKNVRAVDLSMCFL